jgi:hypothetical protein
LQGHPASWPNIDSDLISNTVDEFLEELEVCKWSYASKALTRKCADKRRRAGCAGHCEQLWSVAPTARRSGLYRTVVALRKELVVLFVWLVGWLVGCYPNFCPEYVRADAVNMKDLAGALATIFRELQSGQVQPLLHRGNATLLGRLAFECLKKHRSSLVKGAEADTTELKALLSTVCELLLLLFMTVNVSLY